MNLDHLCQQATTRVTHYINRSAAQHLHLMRRNFEGYMTSDDYRNEISKMLMKVPDLSSGGVELAAKFKEAAESASRVMRSARASRERLQDAHNALAAFYGGVA